MENKIKQGTKSKLFKVFNVRIAMELCDYGHVIVQLQPNVKHGSYVYCFNNTQEVREDFGEIVSKYSKKE